MQSATNTTIVVEEVDGMGIVHIFGEDKDGIDRALARINAITEVPEIGKVYKGKVKSIVAFGAFVEILPGKEGLLHISEIEWRKIPTVEEVLKEGQEIEVKLLDIDAKTSKLKLSRKALLPRPPRDENSQGEDRPHGDRAHGDRARGDRSHGHGDRSRRDNRPPRRDRPTRDE